jgi:hypothetical protein
VPLEVPEWGGEVYVRVLSAKDQAELSDGVKPAEMPIRVLLHCLVDEAGEPILKEEDAEALAEEDFPVILRVFAFVAKLNGLSTKELDEAMESFAPAPDEYSSKG